MMFWYYTAKILYWVFYLLTGIAMCLVLRFYLRKWQAKLPGPEQTPPTTQPSQPRRAQPQQPIETVSHDESMWKDGVYKPFWREEDKSD